MNCFTLYLLLAGVASAADSKPNIIYIMSDDQCVNVYDDPAYAQVVNDLKLQLAERRRQVRDNGSDYPAIEAVLQEFWDYDDEDRAKAKQISHDYRASMEAATLLTNPSRNKKP